MLECRLKSISKSELPIAGLLEDLNKILKLSSWWTDFDVLLHLYEMEGEVSASAIKKVKLQV